MSTEQSAQPLYIPYSGPGLMAVSLLNKGTAFTEVERKEFNLAGLLPHRYETIEQQAERCYQQYSSFTAPIDKHIYLRGLQDTNETLFYYLVDQHLVEMLPVIYTPTVGEACQRFSEIYRRPRGIFVSYPDREYLDDILHNVTKDNVKVIVVSDGSRILGLGDQGAGGMGIPIGKLSLYTACAGISPAYTLPVILDMGTDNEDLLNNPRYIGWPHRRIHDEAYDAFVEQFMQSVQKRWPGVLVQFEDFEQRKAMPLLKRYQDEYCCFNDDIQGTASVTVGSLLAACGASGQKLSEQIIVFAGAGSAGCGIAEQIISQMCLEGLSEQAARKQIYMINRNGLLTSEMDDLFDFQIELAQDAKRISEWGLNKSVISLEETITHTKPTVLIGVSGQAGLFSESMIKTMFEHCQRPIIFPLSNPSSKIEATPAQLLEWTQGQAIVATGSPFDSVEFAGKFYPIAQCNNSYIFPGIGLAVVSVHITRITDVMMMVASEVLAENSPLLRDGEGTLLPELTDIGNLSKQIAFKVAKIAMQQGVAKSLTDVELGHAIDKNFWHPRYRHYKRASI